MSRLGRTITTDSGRVLPAHLGSERFKRYYEEEAPDPSTYRVEARNLFNTPGAGTSDR